MAYREILNSARKIVGAILDVVLPRKERAMRTEKRVLSDLPISPSSHESKGVRITTLMPYEDPAVQDAIRTLKYDGTRSAAKLCADALADYLQEELTSMRAFSPRRILLVAVPLHKSRVRERGFNQIEHVLNELPKEFKDGTLASLAPHSLVRTRATLPQTKLPRRERLTNVRGAFEARDVAGMNVIVLDDVTTTGATLAECARTLEEAGAKVSALALARA